MKVKVIVSLLFLFLLTTCSQSPAQNPTPGTSHPPTPGVIATMLATDPTLELTFNGEECVVDKPDEIPVGRHVFVFHNESDLDMHMVIMRYYPGNTWEDGLIWIEENCGPSGT